MKHLFFTRNIKLVCLLFTLVFGLLFTQNGACVNNSEIKKKSILLEPRVLHVNLASCICGGGAQVLYSICKDLLKKEYFVRVLAVEKSPFYRELEVLQIPNYTTTLDPVKKSGQKKGHSDFSRQLEKLLIETCKKDNINIIHCHRPKEYRVVQKVAKKLGIASVAFYHSYEIPDPVLFRGFSAFMAADFKVVAFMDEANKRLNLGIKSVEHICPPYNDQRLINFVPEHSTREQFFSDSFNIKIKKDPVLCMIANFVACKNHGVLFKAINKLVHQEKFPVQLVLAGSGTDRQVTELKNLAAELKIKDNVFFLGFTPLIPGILHNSDAMVLPSLHESFGIVVLEACLMKTPVILSRATGTAEFLIKHEDTGLLIDPKNVDDLATQIKRILFDVELQNKLKTNAFNLVSQNFTSAHALQKVQDCYNALLN
ncbi:MAG: glycosyltransferase family 4 protein [bacterium]